MALGHGRVFTPRLRFVRLGRKATKHVRTLFDRFWLQAAVRRIANSFRFGMNSGSGYVRYRHWIAVASPFVRPSTVRSVRRV